MVPSMSSSLTADLRRETRPREVMSSFLAQKREMFLVQMALDTKREEVQKLEQKAHAREEALKRAELLLEEVGWGVCCLRGRHTAARPRWTLCCSLTVRCAAVVVCVAHGRLLWLGATCAVTVAIAPQAVRVGHVVSLCCR